MFLNVSHSNSDIPSLLLGTPDGPLRHDIDAVVLQMAAFVEVNVE